MSIFKGFKSLSNDPIFQKGVELLEIKAIPLDERKALAKELISAVYPKAPHGQRVTKDNFWAQMMWEKCAWKGLYDEARREKDAIWISDQRRYHKDNWPPRPIFQAAFALPQYRGF